MNIKNIVIPFCCVALSASAIELAAWRGETVTAKLPAGEKVGRAPAGLTVKTGVLQDVKFVKKPKGQDYAVAADRVLWDAKMDGQRVVSVAVAADAKPGTYKFGDVKVRVVDRVLPPAKEWKYYLDLWQHPWALARASGTWPFSKAHYDAMRPLWKTLAAAGQKTLTVTLVDLPWNHQCYDGYESLVRTVRKADGAWTHDFGEFDRYVAFGRECGLGPHIACYTMCPWGYKVSWLDESGKMHKAEAKPGTPFFAEYWGPYLKAFAAHLKAKGWLQDTYISLDERSPEDLRNTVNFLRANAPGLKIAMAGNRKPSDFKDIEIDSYSQSLGHVNPEFLAEVPQRQKEGKVTTYYICCGPNRPNTFMDSPLDEAFWCGFFPAASGLDGLLRWAYNSWPADACADASYGNWRSGDTFLVYPDGSPSMRFLALVDGIQQAEKFNILKAKGADTEELDALAAKYDLNAAFANASGDHSALIRETKAILNGECRAKPNTISAAEKAAGWQLLWDGKTLDGWVGVKIGCKAPPAKGWKIENGVLTVLPCKAIKDGKWVNLPPEQAALGGGGDIVTVKEYSDFELKLDFRLTKAANSGIKYFFRPDRNKGTCEEYQILDEAHPDATKGRDGNRRVASLYDLMPAHAEKVVRPLGEWNTARLVSKGRHVEHWLNGVKVLEYERGSEEFRKLVDMSKYATWGTDGARWGELDSGRILLQDHADSTVSYRNIKIRDLAKPTLRIYTWEDYIAPSVIKRFEQANGCRIKVDTFDSNESMIASLQAGAGGYDIIMPSSYQIEFMANKGMLQEIDHRKLPNVRKNFDRGYAECIFDPTFRYNVPYAVSYTGFVYRKDKIGNAPIDSWKVFDTPALKGKMSMLDDMRESIGGALLSMGCPLNTSSTDEIAKAADIVIGWKKNVTKFDNEDYKDDIAAGTFVVGMGYSSDANQLMQKDPNIGFSLPKEGFTIAVDEMVIPKDSKDPELAYRFIDFCYDPDVAAANMTEICAPMPVAPAYPKLSEKTRKLVMIDPRTLKNGQVLLEDFSDKPEVQTFYTKAWEKVKSAK